MTDPKQVARVERTETEFGSKGVKLHLYTFWERGDEVGVGAVLDSMRDSRRSSSRVLADLVESGASASLIFSATSSS